MSEVRHVVNLNGCAPTPLAHYLKALGVLRIVAEQADASATGWWKNDSFWLESTLDEESLAQFCLTQYMPTPLVTPWNGGSGFHPKDNQEAITAIVSGSATRFESYRRVIAQCREILDNAPEGEEKAVLLQRCRNVLPDEVLDWLDAAYVLTSNGPKYPPLLGTGGNDGRLEFTNNFMQHLIALLSPNDGVAIGDAETKLQESLFGALSSCRHRGTIGQYDPGNLGGSNNGSGFDGYSTVNSWDYVLMLEGAIMFAAASAKRLESSESGSLSYPFCVRPAGVGYASSDASDESSSRAEMWLPLWDSPATYRALTTLLSEGRVETRKRKARNGVDFARAIASLGIDRGVSEFQRYGFQQRNGLAYFAVPLGRFHVNANPGAEELIAPLDGWLDRFRRAATGKTAPERARRALRRLESSILNLCQSGDPVADPAYVQATLIALGEAESSVAISKQMRDGNMGSGISPLPLLSLDWLVKANDGSCEFRLAAALASVTHDSVGPIRRHIEPIDPKTWKTKYPKWASDANDPAIVWSSASLVANLCAVLNRRLIDVMKSGKDEKSNDLVAPLRGRLYATLPDIGTFIRKQTNDNRIETLFKSLCLLEFPQSKEEFASVMKQLRVKQPGRVLPDAAYGLLKLCFLPHKLDDTVMPLTPQIIRQAIAGRGYEATRLAARRLLASGFEPAAEYTVVSQEHIRRTAAALLFPISRTPAGKSGVDLARARVLRLDHESDKRRRRVSCTLAFPG